LEVFSHLLSPWLEMGVTGECFPIDLTGLFFSEESFPRGYNQGEMRAVDCPARDASHED
jgi:hypothetical protein